MTVRVLFFASLKEAVGMSETVVSLDAPASREALLGSLREVLGESGYRALTAENVRLAVNQELVAGPAVIEPGDEVAFMPPVTGG